METKAKPAAGRFRLKLRSHLARKILIPVTVVLLLAVVLLVVFFALNSAQITLTAEDSNYREAYSAAIAQLNTRKQQALALAISIADNPIAQEAMANQDREALIAAFYPLYQQLDAQFDIPQAQFHLAPATSFLRLHDLEKWGDDLSAFRSTVLETNASGQQTSGIEVGRGGPGIRGVVPVMYQGRQVGSFEIGLNIDVSTLQRFQELYGGEWHIILNPDIASLATLGGFQIETPGPVANTLSFASTKEGFAERDPAVYQQVLQNGEIVINRVESLDVPYGVITGPLHDYKGQIIGAIQVEFDRSAVITQINQASAQIVIVGLALSGLGLGFLLIFIQRMLQPVASLTHNVELVAQGDYSVQVTANTQDELGALAQGFNQMTTRLRDSFSTMESRVAARTRDLATTVEVGQLATSIYEERELTPKLVEYIRAQFGLYYTQIYFIDEARRYAVLRHGTGDVGKELLARQHKLDLAQTSIVARVVQTREPVLVANTEASDIHRPNPLLPNTHSEAALPLVAGDEVFGVLDMQAERAGTFNPENLSVFQAMANQVASALRGAQAYSRAQEAIERAETINRRLTSDTWKGYLDKSKAAGRIGYEYNLESPQPLSHELKHTPEKVVEKDRATQPILLRGQQIGTLLVQEDNDWREWRPDELTLIEGVAGRVAQALEQFRAFDETQSALQATEALYRVSGEVNRAATLDDILQTLVNLTAVGQFDRANFLMFDRPWVDEKPDTATVMAVWERDGSAPRAPLGTAYPVAAFPFIDMMETDKPFIVADRDSDALTDETLRSVLQRLGMRSVVFFALVANNEWVGLLTAQSGNPRSVSDDQVRQLISVSGQAANVIQNIRLLEQARKRALEMETVANVSAAAATILDVDRLLQTVVDLTKQSFDLYHAHVYLLNETGDTLVLSAGSGDAGQVMKDHGHSIALDREISVVATAARTRKGIIIGDVAQNPTHLPNPLLPETRSEMAVPMVVGEVLVGVLDVQSQQVNHFTLEDLRIQSTLADQISVAVENARAYQRQLETAEKLREVDRLKSQFLANMSHELRTPLNSIIGYSEVLLDGIDGDLTEDAIEDVEAIHSGGRHLLTMINEILDLAKIEAGQMKLERRRTELEEIVTDAVHTSQILVKDKSVELKVVVEPDMPPVLGDPIRIRQIILNLLSNASKFTEQGEIVVSYGLQDNQTAFIKVQDTGIGMSPEGLTLIFEQFQQVDGSSTRRAGGTGLGLTITRYLVDMHEGEIFVESELGKGSTFWFTLPLYVAEETPALEAK